MKQFLRASVAATIAVCGCGRSSADTQSGRVNETAATTVAAASAERIDTTADVTVSQPIPVGRPTSAAASSSVSASSSISASASACPRTGLWALCSVEKRLERAGFVPRRLASGGQPRAGFRVRPTTYLLNKSRLEVFVYPTATAANADVARLDTTYAAPRGAANPWGAPPTFVRSANLVAVFLAQNATEGERLTLALTAGAPQP